MQQEENALQCVVDRGQRSSFLCSGLPNSAFATSMRSQEFAPHEVIETLCDLAEAVFRVSIVDFTNCLVEFGEQVSREDGSFMLKGIGRAIDWPRKSRKRHAFHSLLQTRAAHRNEYPDLRRDPHQTEAQTVCTVFGDQAGVDCGEFPKLLDIFSCLSRMMP